MKFKKYNDLIVGLSMLAFGLFYLIMTMQIPRKGKLIDATFFPYILSTIMLIVGLLQTVRGAASAKRFDAASYEEPKAGQKGDTEDGTHHSRSDTRICSSAETSWIHNIVIIVPIRSDTGTCTGQNKEELLAVCTGSCDNISNNLCIIQVWSGSYASSRTVGIGGAKEWNYSHRVWLP